MNPVGCEKEHHCKFIPNLSEIWRVLVEKRGFVHHCFRGVTGWSGSVSEANGSAKSILDWSAKANLDSEQTRAFLIFASCFVLTFHGGTDRLDCSGIEKDRNLILETERKKLLKLYGSQETGERQLICFLHGPGGCGKSSVLKLLMMYAKEYCGFIENFSFTRQTILVSAMTRTSAYMTQGQIVQSALASNKGNIFRSEDDVSWRQIRLLIIEDMSLISAEDVERIHYKLKEEIAPKREKAFGGVNIIFCGDMRQMQPIGRAPAIYVQPSRYFQGSINCYIELKGMHRFDQDPQWGKTLQKFREGSITIEEIQQLNKTCHVPNTGMTCKMETQIVTYWRKKKDRLNKDLFRIHCQKTTNDLSELSENAVIILCDHIQKNDGAGHWSPLRVNENALDICDGNAWEICGEVEPVLCLFKNCKVTLSQNNSLVPNNQIRGTKAIFDHVVLKKNEKYHTISPKGSQPSKVVRAAFASQVDYIGLKHFNKEIEPALFEVRPKLLEGLKLKTKHGKIKTDSGRSGKEFMKLRLVQIPILLDTATTGYRVLGCEFDKMIVNEWGPGIDWIYSVLSRAKTSRGFTCCNPIPYKIGSYKMPNKLLEMIECLKPLRPSELTKEELDEITEGY